MLRKHTRNLSESDEEDSELSIINDEESLESQSLSGESSLESLDAELSHGEDEMQLLNELKQVSKALPTIHSVNESYICSQNNLSEIANSKQQQPSQTSQDFDQYYYRCVENFLKNKKEKLEKKRKEIEETEMSEAKHKPSLVAKQQNKEHVPLVDRIKKIKLKKEHQIMKAKKEQEQKLEQEISQYTFKPKTNKRSVKKTENPQRDLSPLETTSTQKFDDKNVFQPQIDKNSSKIAKKVIESTSSDVVERLYVHAQDNQNKKKEQLLKQYLPDFKPKLYKSNHKWTKSVDHEKSKQRETSETKLNIDHPQKEGSSIPSSQNNIPEDSTCSSSDSKKNEQMPCPAALHKLMQIMSSYSNSNNNENTTSIATSENPIQQKKHSVVTVLEQQETTIPQINLFARTPKAASPRSSPLNQKKPPSEETDPSLQEIDSFKQNLEDMQKNLLALKASFKNFQGQKSPMNKKQPESRSKSPNANTSKKSRPSRSPQSHQKKKQLQTSENSKSPANRRASGKSAKNLASRDTNLESGNKTKNTATPVTATSPFKSECSSINYEPQSLETTIIVQKNPENAAPPKEQTFRPSQPSLNFESASQKNFLPQSMAKFNITRNEYIYNDSERILHQTKPNDVTASAQNLRDIALMTLRKFRNYDH